MLHRAVEIAAVSDHAAADAFDSGLVKKRFPLAEQFVPGDGDGIFGGDCGVSASDDVEVSLKDAVPDRAVVANSGDVFIIRA